MDKNGGMEWDYYVSDMDVEYKNINIWNMEYGINNIVSKYICRNYGYGYHHHIILLLCVFILVHVSENRNI